MRSEDLRQQLVGLVDESDPIGPDVRAAVRGRAGTIRRRRRLLVAGGAVVSIVLVVAAGALVVRDPDETSVQVAVSEADEPRAPDGSTVPGRRTPEAFRAALGKAPILNVTTFGPATLAGLVASSESLVVGRLDAVVEGPVRVFDSSEVACESAEGVPTGEICLVETAMRTVQVRIGDARLTPLDGSLDAPGGEITFEITIESAATNGPAKSEDVFEEITATAPIGSTVAAFLVRSTAGDFNQLAHPSGWAVVLDDGTLSSLAPDGGATQGLGGAATLTELTG